MSRCIKLMREFHDGMYGRVSIGGDISNAFEISHSVKQGCVLAPTLFALYLAAVLDTMTIDLSGASTFRQEWIEEVSSNFPD